MTTTIRPEFFDLVIKELQNYFSGLRLSAEQRLAWLKRLEHFSPDAFRLAVYQLSSTTDRAPSFRDLQKALTKSQGEINQANRHTAEKIEGGDAPDSPEKDVLTRWALAALVEIADPRNAKRRAELVAAAKDRWAREYPRLPGYRTEEQRKAQQSLSTGNKLNIPPMQSERVEFKF